jgi:hypothetical protein
LKPPGWGFSKDKNIQDRIGPSPVLERPERVMERIPRQETPQSGVSGCYKYGSYKFRDKEIERLRFQFNDLISVIYKIFYGYNDFRKKEGKIQARGTTLSLQLLQEDPLGDLVCQHPNSEHLA